MQQVAIKQLHCTGGEAAALQREIQILQRVSHDRNIVQFYGRSYFPEGPVLVMEYLEVGFWV